MLWEQEKNKDGVRQTEQERKTDKKERKGEEDKRKTQDVEKGVRRPKKRKRKG